MNRTKENVAEELREAKDWVKQQERRVDLAQNGLQNAQKRVRELERVAALSEASP